MEPLDPRSLEQYRLRARQLRSRTCGAVFRLMFRPVRQFIRPYVAAVVIRKDEDAAKPMPILVPVSVNVGPARFLPA